GERGGVAGHALAPPDRAPGGAADGDDIAGDGGHGLPRVALEREPEVSLAVEARLLDRDYPRGICRLRPHPLSPSPRCGEGGRRIEYDARGKARAQRLDGLYAEQRQVTRAFGPVQLRDMLDQLQQLVLRERRRVERERIALPVAEVPL